MTTRLFNKVAGIQNPNDLVLTVSASNSDTAGDISCSGADDDVAFQEGLNWLDAKGGGVLLLADGNYVFGKNGITMHQMENVHIIGNSWKAKVDTSAVDVLSADSGTPGFGIAFGTDGGGDSNDAKYCSVQGFWMFDDDIQIVSNIAIGEGRGQCTNNRVVNMYIEGYGLAAIAMNGVDPFVSSNRIDNIGDEAVQFNGVTRGIITNNQISNTGFRDGNTAAIRLIGNGEDTLVSTNTLKNISNRGIDLRINNSIIEANILSTFHVITPSSNPNSALPIEISGNNNLLSGNIIKDVDSQSTNTYTTITITATAARNIVTNNNFIQTTTNAGLFNVIAGATKNSIGGNFTNGGNITETDNGTGTVGVGANTDLT